MPRAHWAGAFSRLRVASVPAEAYARTERLTRCGPALPAPVTLCGLAEAGLCTPRPAEEPAVPDQETGQPGPTPEPVLLPAPLLQEALARQALRPGTLPSGMLPRRRSPESPQAPELPPGEPGYEPPPPEVLTRVLDALRKL